MGKAASRRKRIPGSPDRHSTNEGHRAAPAGKDLSARRRECGKDSERSYLGNERGRSEGWHGQEKARLTGGSTRLQRVATSIYQRIMDGGMFRDSCWVKDLYPVRAPRRVAQSQVKASNMFSAGQDDDRERFGRAERLSTFCGVPSLPTAVARDELFSQLPTPPLSAFPEGF